MPIDWKVESIQGVVFIAPKPGFPDALSTWASFGIGSPMTFNQISGPAGPSSGSTATGVIGDLNVSLTLQPGRYDVVLSAANAASPLSASGPAYIPSFDAAIEYLTKFCEKIISAENPQRVALVLSMAEQYPNADEAGKAFKEIVPISWPLEGAQELNFSFNLQKKLGTAGWSMNRICRWTTSERQILTMEIGPAGQMHTTATSKTEVLTFNVDVNTTPRPIPLGQSQASSAFAELVKEATAIKLGGYDRFASN